MNTYKQAWFLCRYFFKIGWFTFGGGWSIIAQIQKDFVDGRRRITDAELLDLVSVGRSIPGTMVTNVAYLLGSRLGGPVCGFASVAGLAAPSVIILSLVTVGYHAVRGNPWAARALMGVRSAVVPIIITAALKLRKSALVSPICWAVCAASCILSLVFQMNNVLLILLGAVIGLVLGRKEQE